LRWSGGARKHWNDSKAGMLGPSAGEPRTRSDRELVQQASGRSGTRSTGSGEVCAPAPVDTGTAPNVPDPADLHTDQKEDVLVMRATDPGWTTVFLILSSLVLETGGILAHGSCTSREYGVPAMPTENAMQDTEAGPTTTVNGDAGEGIVPEPVAAELAGRMSKARSA
jgi:phosphohistidine swiveling domain-containing protein